MKKILLIVVLLVPSLLLASCGYRFSPGGEHIDKALQDVFVENFDNRTTEANVENYFRNSFIDQMRRGSRFDVVASRKECDALLSGSIQRIDTSHVSYSSVDVSQEDRVRVTMTLTFQSVKTGTVIWASENFTGKKVYTVSTNTSTTERNRKAAIRELADDMAEKAYRSIMSGF